MRKIGNGFAAALGAAQLSCGTHLFTFTILHTKNNFDTSGGISVGVHPAGQPFKSTELGDALGVHVFSAQLFGPGSEVRAPMLTSLRGRGNGATVCMRLRMDVRELSFSFNGGPMETTALRLTGDVRPWLRLSNDGDEVSLTEHHSVDSSSAHFRELSELKAQVTDTWIAPDASMEHSCNVVRRTESEGSGTALGALVLAAGSHLLTFKILSTRDDFAMAAGILLGIIDAEPGTDRQTFALDPATGHLLASGSQVAVLPSGSLRGRGTGAVVMMKIEFATSRVSFSVNGGPWQGAVAQLPSQVRPWVSLFCPGDAVELSSCF